MPTLDFKGKQHIYAHHLTVPYRPLVPDPARSLTPGGADDNLIIHGDNLEALKALLPRYAGRVKCIYIDPPYNTGNEGWIYNDKVNSPLMKAWLKENGPVDGEDLERHDKWLCMMWPRLHLLKELLANDGLVFISIDDVENARLIEILRDVFGEDMFLGQFIWKSRQNKDNRNKSGMSIDHEYIVVFGRNIVGEQRLESNFSNPDDDRRGPWASGNMVGLASKEARPNLHFDLIDFETGINYGCPDRGWRYGPKRMTKLIAEKRIIWPSDESGRPREKVFLYEMERNTNVSSVIDRPIFTRNGTDTLERIMGRREFDFPKPPEIIQFLIEQHPDKDAIALDSFAGSGTTAHAVLQANKKDGGNRRFILIEMEDYADRLTAERVRRVVNGYDFSGIQKEELMRERITWSMLKKASRLTGAVREIEKLHGQEYDRIRKEVKGGELIVTGEKSVAQRTEGLGGTFTYCTLGEPLDAETMLSGEALPDWPTLAAWLLHTATGVSAGPADLEPQNEDGLFHGNGATDYYLLYRPEREWLLSHDAMFDEGRAKRIAAVNREGGRKAVVFGPGKYIGQRDLTAMGITFCQLPYELHRAS